MPTNDQNGDESKFGRRSQDRFFTEWIRPMIPWAIGGLIASAIGIWIRVAVLEATVRGMQLEAATRMSTEQTKIRDEKITQLTESIEKITKSIEEERENRKGKKIGR